MLGKDSSSTACGIGAGQPLRSPCAANKQISEGIFTLSPSATWQITSPVAGLIVGKVFLLTASCHSLFMKIWKEGSKAGSHLRARPRGIARSFYLFVGFSAGCLIQGAQLAGAPKPHGSGGDVLAQTEQQLPADKKDPHRGSSPLTGSFEAPGSLGQRHRARFTRGTGAASPPAAGARQPGELRGLCSGTAGPGAAGSAWGGPALAELRATAAGKERPARVATPTRVGTPTYSGTPTHLCQDAGPAM